MNTTYSLGTSFSKVFWDAIKYQLKIDEYPTKQNKAKSHSASKQNTLKSSGFQKSSKINPPLLEIQEPDKNQEFQEKIMQIKIDEIESWYLKKFTRII